MTRRITPLDGRGAVYVDTIIRRCLARRRPVADTARALMVATDHAARWDPTFGDPDWPAGPNRCASCGEPSAWFVGDRPSCRACVTGVVM